MKKTACVVLQIVLFGLLLLTAITTYAQKLPNKQEVSLRAPANIKIDGKATEWNTQLQAYNKNTQIFYTLCNDDNNLYLTLQATDAAIVRKIIANGLVFSINNSIKQKDNMPASITFPLLTRTEYSPIITTFTTNPARNLKDTAKTKFKSDSLMNALNVQLSDKLKEIGVDGIPGITDTRISVYNEFGIKAMTLIDNKKTLTYEMAIPLKLLGQSETGANKLSYSIKLNGSTYDKDNNVTTVVNNGYILRSSPGNTSVEVKATPERLALLANNDPTDFSGEYTLAKK